MDIRFSSRNTTIKHDELQFLCRTPRATIENLLSLCTNDEHQKFEETMAGLSRSSQPANFAVEELGEVMMEAIRRDNVRFVSTLLSYGFPIHTCFALEVTFLKAKGALECYINAGWDINEPVDILKPPVLGYAVEDEDMTTWLLDRGADPNRRCEIDCTALSYAVQLAPISTINLMLDRGGDVKKGQLLQYAVFRTTEVNTVISLLVDNGAPLNAAMHQDGNILMRFYPLSLGTPLHIAVELDKMDVVQHLIHLGADTSVKDANGYTVVEWARKLDKTQIVEFLENETHSRPLWPMLIMLTAFGLTLLASHRRRHFYE